MMPYYCEMYNLIIDIDNMGIMSIPRAAISECIKIHQLQFKNHLHKIFLYNPSWTFNVIFKVIVKLFNQKFIGRLRMINKGKERKFMEFMDPESWEKRYGGNCEDIQENCYWPPAKLYTNPVTRKEIVENKLMAFEIIGDTGDTELFVGTRPLYAKGNPNINQQKDNHQTNNKEDEEPKWKTHKGNLDLTYLHDFADCL